MAHTTKDRKGIKVAEPVVETPTCEHCRRELTARDATYGGKGTLCKRCKQDAERRAMKGTFTPFVRSEIVGGKWVDVPVRGNRALRRHPVMLSTIPTHEKAPKIPRASRRAATRKAQTARKAQVA